MKTSLRQRVKFVLPPAQNTICPTDTEAQHRSKCHLVAAVAFAVHLAFSVTVTGKYQGTSQVLVWY